MRTRWKNKLLQRKYDRGMADSSSWWAENREQIWLGAQTLPLLQSSSTPSTSGSMGGKLQWTRYRHLHLTSTLSSHWNGMWIKRGGCAVGDDNRDTPHPLSEAFLLEVQVMEPVGVFMYPGKEIDRLPSLTQHVAGLYKKDQQRMFLRWRLRNFNIRWDILTVLHCTLISVFTYQHQILV